MRTFAVLVATLLAGCGVDTLAFHPPVFFQSFDDVAEPHSEVEFMQQMTSQGIRLTAKDLDEVTRYTVVAPTGEWTPGPQQDPQLNLKGHFQKHGHEFKPPAQTVEEYRQRAVSFASQPQVGRFFDAKYYQDRKFVSVVRWDRQSQEFGVVRLTGQMATYFLRDDAEAGRFVKVPREMFPGMQPIDLNRILARPRYRQAS